MELEQSIFQFEDCDLCGQIMEFENLNFRNIMEDHEILRFDFCPSCGSKIDILSLTSDGKTIWRSLSTKWSIQRRLEKKRFVNGFKA
jgi:rRNA maturation protein Nop10